MDSLALNKIAGAVLFSLLVLVGLRTFVEILYPKGDENLAKGVTQVTREPVPAPGAKEEPKAEAAAKAPEMPLAEALQKANVEAGEKAAKKLCATCHTFTKGGPNGVGPNLYGIVGREIGKHPGFSFSPSVAQKGGKWEAAALYEWIKNPKAFIPNNRMAFAGDANDVERASIIAYLNKQSDAPVELAK